MLSVKQVLPRSVKHGFFRLGGSLNVADNGRGIQLKNLALTEHELTLVGNSTITSTKLAGRELIFEISAN